MAEPTRPGLCRRILHHTGRTVLTAAVATIASIVVTTLVLWAARPFEIDVQTPGPAVVIIPPVISGDGPPADGPGPMGWHDDPAAVEAVIATLPVKVFADTPAGQAPDVLPANAYLWDAPRKAIGKPIPTRNQGNIGACVAFGAACAVEYLECVQVAAGAKERFADVSQEVIYAGSRVQIGGGKIRGDGSVGAWAAQWCQQYGVVARGKYPSIDLSAFNESTCRKLGDAGCPADLVPVAKERPVKAITQVKTTDELKKALASRYPVTVASNVGFGSRGPYVRNAKGQLKASGTWAHQMCFIGYDEASGFCVMNSWGPDWVSGPAGPGSPPPGSFWVDEPTAKRMLGAGDSWAYSALTGFPLRKLDWFVHRAPPRPLLLLRGESWLAA